MDYIVKGYTSKLQVCDVGLNKPFKARVKACYEQFMMGNTDNRKVKRLDVACWVDRAWKDIPDEGIVNTWESIGFKNENGIDLFSLD